MYSRFIFLAILVAALASAETDTERGKRVVNEALQALGGDAFLHMEDRVESGRAYSFYRAELSGLSVAKMYTRYVTRPAKPVEGEVYQRERQSFGKDELFYYIFNQEGAFEVTFRGAQPMADTKVTNYRDSVLHNFFYILRMRRDEPGLEFLSKGGDFLENRPVEIVDIIDAKNFTVTVYFDRTTKLPMRQVYKRRNPEFKDFDTEVTLWGKYRDVGGGVKWPFDIRRDRNGEKIFEMFSDSVEINKNLADNLFTLPADVKRLQKAK